MEIKKKSYGLINLMILESFPGLAILGLACFSNLVIKICAMFSFVSSLIVL